MSNQGSGTKWLVGCLVIGLLFLLLCGGGLFLVGLFGYRAAQSVSTGFEDQVEQMQFAAAWQPPEAGAGPERLFPENVNAWQRVLHDDDADIPELALAHSGLHARYESGVAGIDVYAYEVAAAEQAAVFQGASDAIDAVSYSTKVSGQIDDGTSHRLSFTVSPPELQGRMWWSRGWLFVFMADKHSLDLDAFQRQYLTTIAAQPTLEELTPAEAISEDTAPAEPSPLGAPEAP